MSAQLTLWPVHPKPFEGEVLSSWLFRIATGNNLNLASFRKIGLPKVVGAGIDVDLIDAEEFFQRLADGTGVPMERVLAGGFAGDEGTVYTRRIENNLEWVVPLKRRAGWTPNKCSSLPFCPSCLASDVVPFYRKAWRYAFFPVCPEHGLLLNACPSCGHEFSYVGAQLVESRNLRSAPLAHCAACGRKFTSSGQRSADVLLDMVLEVESFILTGLTERWVLLGDRQVHIAMFLRGLRDLVMLIMRPSTGPKVAELIASALGNLVYPGVEILGRGPFESRPAVSRAWLLVLAFWLAREWPERILWLVKVSGLSVPRLLRASRHRPAWMVHSRIEALFDHPVVRSPEEMHAARDVLAGMRGFAPNKKEVSLFMRTGTPPLIRPLSRPATPAARKAMDDEARRSQRERELKRLQEGGELQRPRELYPAILKTRLQDDLFDTIDDTDKILASLIEKRRRDKTKPPCE